MPPRLLLLSCIIGFVLAKNPPDTTCLVINLEYVRCTWNDHGTPEHNYTFISWFDPEKKHNCTHYLTENNMNTGCIRPIGNGDRFTPLKFLLVESMDGKERLPQELDLKSKVKLNPPKNLTVKNGSDFNLWFYWNQTKSSCEESEVRFRKNNKSWERSIFSEKNSYCINLPSSTSRYELQVRRRIGSTCGQSDIWSEWSEPVFWGFNNGTDPNQVNKPLPFVMPVLYVVGAITLILMVIMLVRRERFVFISVVPKPSLINRDIEDFFQFSFKERYKVNYDERACTVREYTYTPRSDSESSDNSNLSVITDQTDCSITVNDAEDPS